MVLMTSKNVRLGQTLRLSRETFSLTSQNKRAQKKKQNKTKCSHFKWIAFRMSCICVFHFNGVDDYSRVEIYIYIYYICNEQGETKKNIRLNANEISYKNGQFELFLCLKPYDEKTNWYSSKRMTRNRAFQICLKSTERKKPEHVVKNSSISTDSLLLTHAEPYVCCIHTFRFTYKIQISQRKHACWTKARRYERTQKYASSQK